MRSKKENIAEYILYLWQMEDYLRAFPEHANATPELQEINEMMHREGIMEGGHLALANNALEEMEDLHMEILNEEALYRAAIMQLQPSLNLLKAKTDRPTMSDIEACLTLLYQIMMLRLQKKEISKQTADVQKQATMLLQFFKQQRFEHILAWFETNMPVAESELVFASPFQCLVAVMLSAQCTDKRVNMVTPALFEAYPSPEALAKATSDEVFEYVKSVSYPRSKAEHLVQMAQRLVEVYDGIVPDNIDDLQTLQGVGRKTANVVCAVIWNQPTMAVDTHIFRVSERLGLTTNSKNPLQTEKALVQYIPADIIPKAHHWLLLHGRYVCQARKPQCERCGLAQFCRFFNKK